MSLMKTKPHWCPNAVANDSGWVNPTTNELLVAIGNLKTMLAAEQKSVAPVVEVVKEAKIKKPKKGQQIIAEVVEYPLDANVIGE